MSATTPPSLVLPRDVLRLGSAGLRARPLRALLAALGIAIGIGAMVAVVGVSSSSQAELRHQLASLGTNLLTVTPGKSWDGTTAVLPPSAVPMIARIEGVESAAGVGVLTDVNAYRSPLIDPENSNSLQVAAADLSLRVVIGATLQSGTWLNPGPTASSRQTSSSRPSSSPPSSSSISSGSCRYLWESPGTKAPPSSSPSTDSGCCAAPSGTTPASPQPEHTQRAKSDATAEHAASPACIA